MSILKHGEVMEFTHVHVPDVFPIELTVYPPSELRNRPRSSTDGKPIVRIRDSALRQLCEREHQELWRRYLADASTPSLQDILAAEDADDSSSSGAALLEHLLEDPFEGGPFLEDDEQADEPSDASEPEEEEEEEREPRLRRPCGRQRGGARHTRRGPDD